MLFTIVFYSLTICYTHQDPNEFNLKMYAQEADTPEMKTYLNFISTYGRTYGSSNATAYRYRVFKKNYLEIMTHNALGNNVPFEMEVNEYADLTEEEVE